jgi:hypothetical protein
MVCALAGSACVELDGPRPPAQPASGPGGADYAHAAIAVERFGEDAQMCWIFSPESPQPEIAPVVIFLHGWLAVDRASYGAWIEHLVRKGHIVIYPRYQEGWWTRPDEMRASAVACVETAFARIADHGPVRPEGERLAWIGHSLGGTMAANFAAGVAGLALPPPAVLMVVQPGGAAAMPVRSLASIPSDTLTLVVTGDADRAVDDDAALLIAGQLGHVQRANFSFVTVRSDLRGTPDLLANHLSPAGLIPAFPPPLAALEDGVMRGVYDAQVYSAAQRAGVPLAPDALDYYGYWKLLDGLLDAAYRNQNRDYALGGAPQQRYMGQFSNGQPVTPILVSDLFE